ncbi:hypothetical protein Pmar_PMAR012794, partial [Perkinsus marinus ATCC 50983]
MKYQFGFTSGKSCRDPVRLLWKKWESTNQIASVFVDFQEAFDSLSWEASWKVLKSAGMPVFLVNIVKRIYADARVAIRVSQNGKVSDVFSQR